MAKMYIKRYTKVPKWKEMAKQIGKLVIKEIK